MVHTTHFIDNTVPTDLSLSATSFTNFSHTRQAKKLM